MNSNQNSHILAVAALVLALSASVTLAVAEKPAPVPRIEVCFVLDTTGSMGGLIQGAKEKIWSIANEIAGAKPTPRVKFGLIGYRDRGDEYITRVFDLTDDLDHIYEKLQAFSANGGGDGPESVNQALHESVTRMAWDEDRDVLKIVFLVGDAPPHMDYKDDVKYSKTCEAAVRKDLIINTIQCGGDREATKVWQRIAALGEGSYVAIQQSGGMVSVSTPMDKKLAKLSSELEETRIGYGDASIIDARKDRVRHMALDAAPSAAARASYSAKAVAADPDAYRSPDGKRELAKKAKEGHVDLLKAIEYDAVALEELEAEKLPDEMKSMNEGERKEYIEKAMARRKELREKIATLSRERDDFLVEHKKKLAAEGKADGFDDQVGKMIREQASRKGIKY